MPFSIRRPASASIRWHRSLYWRIAAGLFAFLALMLAAELALFLWMNDRIAASMPARSPRLLGLMVASDVATALADDPAIDLEAHVRGQFGRVLQPLMVVLRDGRTATNHEAIPGELLEAIRQERLEARPFGRGRGARAPRGLGETVPIQVDGRPVGRVIVWRGSPPLSRILRQLGPTLGVMAGSILVIGSGLIALFVFGPTRRRLKDVEDTTARLGAGDLSARAPEQGGDEVAALGRAFNRMADELASRAAALDASNRVRRQLLADVSHELMTPLTAMRGYVETLAMSEAQFDAPTRARYLGIALEETHRLERIIGDLLDLARLEGGGGTFRREPVDIAAVFDRVAARHGRDLEARAIRLTRHVDPAARTVPADPDRLEQALQNLAANALRHTPDGGEVSLTASATPVWEPPSGGPMDGIVLTVRDSGPGIPVEHLPLIFDRFYKADASRKAAGGSGLGLSIVKAIVERHGGTISARNDDGAVFEVVLPRGHQAGHGPS